MWYNILKANYITLGGANWQTLVAQATRLVLTATTSEFWYKHSKQKQKTYSTVIILVYYREVPKSNKFALTEEKCSWVTKGVKL